jgi:hypothetical protein
MKAALLLALAVALPGVAAAAERYAVIVSGAAGGEKYAQQQRKWRTELATALKVEFAFPDDNIVVLDDENTGSTRANAENVTRVLGDLRERLTRDDTLMLVLLGHGTFDGADAKFNLVGPDMSAGEWKGLLDGMPGVLVVVNTTESSFPFLEELSQKGRVIVTATDSVAQRFATVFPEQFIRALSDPAADLDKNGRLSIWEAFVGASAGVKKHYEQRGQLSTERPLLDDDGDRKGREADTPGEDGTVAQTVFLDPPPGATAIAPAVSELERQRAVLEEQINDLKSRKSSIPDPVYNATLEQLLVELAKISQQIRQGS